MHLSLESDLAAIARIEAVPTILEVVAELTGLRFVCIARVIESTLYICAVLDKLNLGFHVGDSFDVKTTLCEKVREKQAPVIIDSVPDSEYRNHPAPKLYGFRSYFSIPLYRPDGEYFGTLCGLDPEPAHLSTQAMRKTLGLFAELIARQLANEAVLGRTRLALDDAIETSVLREQFIAALSHDVRTPLATILNGIDILGHSADENLVPLLDTMRRSGKRISALIDDVTDFARGRMGGGIAVELRHDPNLEDTLLQVVEELRQVYPGRTIETDIPSGVALLCDAPRIAQLLSNLMKNAIIHGSPGQPVSVSVASRAGTFEMAVTNNGPEIPSEIQDQLFKPFWQSTTCGSKKGLGLGLYIASEIARSHGGFLDVTSAGGQTTFAYRVKQPPAAGQFQ
ncbi:MAG TPA: GAF domain-containing sensor histidine kinase [Pseudoduganella sp.]